jgi:hypothetical protein
VDEGDQTEMTLGFVDGFVDLLTFVFTLCSLYAPSRTGLLSGRPCGTLRNKQLSQLIADVFPHGRNIFAKPVDAFPLVSSAVVRWC